MTKELKQIREENDFHEINLNKFKQKLKELEEQFNKSPSISIRQDSSPFIKKISVLTTSGKFSMNINKKVKFNFQFNFSIRNDN